MTETPQTIPVDFDPFGEADGSALPLTEPQREMWAAAQMGDDASCAYNQCFALTLRGNLSVESMQRALQQVMEQHDALRVTIPPDGQQQSIASTVPVELPLIDLTQSSEQSRRDTIERILQGEAAEPFDLVNGPLLRAKLIREAPDLHRLVLTVHHIVCDGWSSAVLLEDLGQMYAASCYGLRPQLPTAASYREYVLKESARADSVLAVEDETYWMQQYADSIPVTDLPPDRPRPGTKTYSGACQELRIDEASCRAIRTTGTRHGCTLFITLLAAFQALIARLSGQEDFVVGIPIAGQALLDNGHLVGHCVNMIPLRCRIAHAASFVDHLRNARQAFLDAQSHQQLTFGRLVRRLNVPRDPGRTPLVSVTFNIDKIGTPFEFGNLTLESVASPHKSFVNFELSINVVDNGRDLLIECHHNSDLFASETVARWLSHYNVLLLSIASDPAQRVDELPLLTEAEAHELLVAWNDTHLEYPPTTLLHELFEAQAQRTPEAIAVSFEDQRLTYRELDARTNQLAGHLLELGVGPDTLVPLCAERSLEMVVGMIGILKAGAAYVPLDPDYPPQRIAYVLNEVRSPVVLTQQHLRSRLPNEIGRVVQLDAEWTRIAHAFPDRVSTPASASNIAYVIYTSGSTGQPKGVLIPHAGICNLMLWLQSKYRLDETDVLLQKTPFGFDASVWEFFAPLITGGKLVMARPGGHLDPTYLADAILAYGVSILKVVPSQLRMLLEEPAFWRCSPPLKHVFSGGEPLTTELCDVFHTRLPHATLHNLYGPTETSIDATAWDCPRESTRPVIPIGRPIGNTRVCIVNTRDQLSPIGVPGELLVGGIGLARGYLNRPELTAERFIPDPFRREPGERVYRTGDLARYLPDGTIEYLGRIDAQVKVRGYRIEPGEIEAALVQHPAVRQVAVIAREDSPGEKRLVAYFVAENQNTDLVDQLRSRIRTTMPEYMVPTYFIPLAALPLNHNGKLDRRALPPPDAIERVTRQPAVASRTPPEEMVTNMFREVLSRSDFGIYDNFFDLGGDSIMAARLMARLRAASGMDLPLRNLFERPTVAQLAEAIDALSWLAQSGTPAGAAADRERIEL